MRTIALAVLAVTLLAGTVGRAAEDEAAREWQFLGDDQLPYVMFGIPATEDNVFAVYCDNKRKTADLTFQDTTKGAKAGRAITIEIAAGAKSATFQGKTMRSRGIHGYARKIDIAAALAVLRAPGPVTVKMSGTTLALPAKQRANVLGEFIAACKLD